MKDPVIVNGAELLKPFTYDSGMIRLDPVTKREIKTADPKGAAWPPAHVNLPTALRAVRPQIFLSRLTTYGMHRSLSDPAPTYDHRLVWVVRYPGPALERAGAPLAQSAGGGLSYGGSPAPPAPDVPHDSVSIIDAATGRSLLGLDDVPDAVALPDPT